MDLDGSSYLEDAETPVPVPLTIFDDDNNEATLLLPFILDDDDKEAPLPLPFTLSDIDDAESGDEAPLPLPFILDDESETDSRSPTLEEAVVTANVESS